MQISEVEMETKKGTALSPEEKSSAAFLRERFLFLIASLPANKTCKISMYGNTEVSAQIRAFDLPFENILVENLKPHQQSAVPRAILRTKDVKYIEYEDI